MKRSWLLAGALALSACKTAGPDPTGLSRRDEATLLLQRDPKAAVPLLEGLTRENPTDLLLARALAEAHVKAGTAELFLKQLATDNRPIAHYQKGLVLFTRAADAASAAIVEFQAALTAQPQEPEFHYRLGLALLESEKFDEAMPRLKQAVALAPERTGWSLPLAKALYRTGDSKAAVAQVRIAVTHAPTPNEVRQARGLMEQIGDPFAAAPKQIRPQLEQGLQYLQQTDSPQQAIVTFEEILQQFPDLGVVHALLGLAFQRSDDAGRAVDEFRRAIELAPEDGKNHLYLAELYLERQRAPQAKELYEKALDRNPVLDLAWRRLGDLALERQDLVSARTLFQTASSLAPEDSGARGKLALAFQLEGDWPAADRELKQILKAEPENLEFVLRLGVLHTERYNRAKNPADKQVAATEARKWLNQLLEKQPDNALASRALESIKGP